MLKNPPLVLVLAVCALLALLPKTAHARRAQERVDRVERKILVLINRARQRHGERALRISNRISRTADHYSRHLARGGYFAHGAWQQRISRASGTGYVGEVLAWSAGVPAWRQPSWVVSAWMHSSEHRAVLLNGAFRRAGVGRRVGGGRTWYTVDVAR